MSHSKINTALALRLKALNLPTAYENAPFTPTNGELYLRENHLPVPPLTPTLESDGFQDNAGIYQVSVMAPAGEYKKKGFDTAEQVRAHFVRGLVLTESGVKVKIERASVGPALTVGDRFMIPVSVQYRSVIQS